MEKLNLPDGFNFCPLVGSVVELKEMVKEHMFTDWDLLWDLGRVDQRATNQGPQTSPSSRVMPPLGSKCDTSFTEATTQSVSLAVTNAESVRLPPHQLE